MRRVLVLLPEAEQKEYDLQFHDTVAMTTEEDWICKWFQDMSNLRDYLREKPVLNALNWDVSLDRDLDEIRHVRQEYQNTFLMLLADSSVSPMQYIRPGIAPNSLLLKPYTREELAQALREMVVNCQQDETDQDVMLIHTREGDYRIPYAQIYYVEARQKKLYVRTKTEEFGFYSSMEDVKREFPEVFVQCHRSYVVNLKRIWRLDLPNQQVVMEDGISIPVARSYKKIMREQWMK